MENLVNYTSIPTTVAHEIYVPETNAPESIAYLMRNCVLVEFFPLIEMAAPNHIKLLNSVSAPSP